jgi:antitoxin component YwqK of YwqJK toxin-antitoxin module
MLRKKPFIAAAVIVVVIVFIVIFRLCSGGIKSGESAFKAIPDDAAFVVQIHDADRFLLSAENDSSVAVWKNIPEIKQIFLSLEQLISEIKGQPQAENMLKNPVFLVSVHSYDEANRYLFVIELSQNMTYKEFADVVTPLAENSGYTKINERRGQNRLEVIMENDTLHFGHFQNVISISSNFELVQSSIQQLQQDEDNGWSAFSGHQHRQDELLTLFTRQGSLKAFIDRYFIEKSFFPAFLLPDSGSMAFLIKENIIEMQLNGTFSALPDPVDFSVMNLWRNSLRNSAMGMTGRLDDLQLPEQIAGLFQDGFFECVLSPNPDETGLHAVMLLPVNDTTGFYRKALSFSSSLNQRTADNYFFHDHQVRMLTSDTLFRHHHFFTSLLPDYKYLMFAGQTLILSTHLSVLEKAAANHETWLILSEQSDSHQDNKNSFHINIPDFYPLLIVSARPEYKTFFETSYPVLASFKQLKFISGKQQRQHATIQLTFSSGASVKPLTDAADWFLEQLVIRNESEYETLLSFPELAYEGQPDGSVSFLYPDSTLQAKGAFHEGKATGTWRFYTIEGTYQASVEFSEGMAHGRAVYYRHRPDSRMHVSCMYEKDVLKGQYIEFHKNGKPALSVLFSNGKMNGRIRLYYAEGIIMAETEMKDNARIAPWLLYSVTGDFIDMNDFNSSGLILNNYSAFIHAFGTVLHKKLP